MNANDPNIPDRRGDREQTYADIVLTDAVVYTADRMQPRAEAVAVRGGEIVHVGSSDGAGAWIGPKTEVIALKGRMVLPGFRDAHIHPLTGSLGLMECRLTGPPNRDNYLQEIAIYARTNEARSFIRGGGWLSDAFPPCGPHRRDIDADIADRPVFLKSMDGHSAWVNSKALQAAGIDRSTPDPPGGRIERDAATGDPTGTFREWSAMSLVESCLPAPTCEDLVEAGRAFMKEAAALGIVSVHEAMARIMELETYRRLDQNNELTLRVHASLLCEPEKGMAQLKELEAMRRTYQGRLLFPGAVKIFLDGVVEGHTARLLEPYADRPGFYGERLWEPDALNAVVSSLDEDGFQIHIHAVGDGAVRMALDAFSAAVQANGRRDTRHRIAHCDLIDSHDLDRFSELGVIAIMQPIWFYQEKNFARTALPFLGVQRAESLYRMHSLLNAGGVVAYGSDWPFSGELNSFNPLDGLQIGVTRTAPDADELSEFYPDERVDLATMIDCHTIWGAYADFEDHRTGSLTVGKSADLVVLDRNLFSIPPTEISKSRVLMTLFEGRPVFISSHSRESGNPVL